MTILPQMYFWTRKSL